VRTRVTEAARGLGIEPLLARMPEDLSGGERQRVALARALVRRPRVFLLDEPLAGVDPNQRAALRGEIRRLHRELGAITIMVTHDQVEAMTLADRVVVLREGRLQQTETPQRLYVRPANLFVAGFVGTPPMNQLEGEVQTAPGGVAVFVRGILRLAVPGRYAAALGGRPVQPVTAGLRPEHVHVRAAASEHGPGLRARIEHLETWGPLRFAWLRLGDVPIVGVVAAGLSPDPAVEVRVDLEPEELHLFDSATGQALAVDAPQHGKDASP
jgi:multiple sugar transport system ATP-binding protein